MRLKMWTSLISYYYTVLLDYAFEGGNNVYCHVCRLAPPNEHAAAIINLQSMSLPLSTPPPPPMAPLAILVGIQFKGTVSRVGGRAEPLEQ
jgi:hypothetical protein